VTRVADFAIARGYDGVDLDMEPMKAADGPSFVRFVRALRGELKARNAKLLLTAATQWEPAIWGQIHNDLDQVNLMSYDLAGPWPGWKTWHNSALYTKGNELPSGKPMPSVDQMVGEYLRAGVPLAKLGVGIDFYGYVWTRVSEPNKPLNVAKVTGVSYADIMDKHHKPEHYRWHEGVEAAYLSIDPAGAEGDRFISYDDERTCRRKIEYVRARGLGGVIIWELTGGHRRNQPAGKRDPLLAAIAGAVGR
jgi:chitinase